MAKNIVRTEKIIKELLSYLSENSLKYYSTTSEIVIEPEPDRHNKVFKEISSALSGSKYGVQEDEKTLTITVFNSTI